MQSVAMLWDQPLLPVAVTLPVEFAHAQSSTITSGNDLRTKDANLSKNNMINARFLLGTQVSEVLGLLEGVELGEVQLPVQLTVVLG